MKASFVALAVVCAPLVAAHYTLPDLIVDGTPAADWLYVRETANFDSQGPVTDVTSEAIRCYEESYTATAGQTSTATVSAGSVIGFQADNSFYHPGYFSAYLSLASPAADSADAGTDATWFKIWEDPPVYENGELVFPSQTITQFTFTIPPETPSGQYLVRGEQIALHVASTYGGAQFYLSCGQINIVNGGDGVPGPLVSFPGAYTGYEPGILIDIYDLPANYTGYQSPGPAVWPAFGIATPPPPPPSSEPISPSSHSSAPSNTPTTVAPPPPVTSSSAGTVAEYGQCGGTGYTGATACVSPYTCHELNDYYSQCY